MSKLSELKTAFRAGQIPKAQFIEQMHSWHERLFEYAEFIKTTDIKEISITDGKVIMESRVSGIKMVCDKDDHRIAPMEILNFDFYEKDDAELIFKLMRDGFKVFDVGANFGWYSLNVAKMFPNSQIYAFEPVPKTLAYLEENVRLNNCNNIKIYNFGFSNEDKEMSFYYYASGSGNASLVNVSEAADATETKGLIKKMDNFVAEQKIGPDFIKCDVEGAELLVFQGGLETIKEFKPIIFTEMLRKWLKKFNYHPNDIIKLLLGCGYSCFVTDGSGLKPIEIVNDETLETNFFFLHNERHSHIISGLVKKEILNKC